MKAKNTDVSKQGEEKEAEQWTPYWSYLLHVSSHVALRFFLKLRQSEK